MNVEKEVVTFDTFYRICVTVSHDVYSTEEIEPFLNSDSSFMFYQNNNDLCIHAYYMSKMHSVRTTCFQTLT